MVGIGIGFGIGIDCEDPFPLSIPIPIAIPTPNLAGSGYLRDGIRITETPCAQTERVPGIKDSTEHEKEDPMKAVIQRVTESAVRIGEETVGRIGPGLVVLLGVGKSDGPADADWLADKICHLRVFEDQGGKMNRSLHASHGEMLIVSQFTLYGDCRKGRRPSFTGAGDPDAAKALYEYYIRKVQQNGIRTQSGRFGAAMTVMIVNDGPVTLILETP